MPSAIQTIFREVAPYLVARDLGLVIHEKGGLSFIDHPTLETAVLWMSHGEFISSDPQDPFLAGDIFDFLALHLGSYDAAVDHVIDKYRLLAVPGAGGKIDTHRHQYVGDLRHGRNVFCRLLAMQSNLLNTSRYAAAIGWLESRRIQPRNVMRAIMVAKGDELLSIIDTDQCDRNPSPNVTYIVYPYFNKYHSIAKLVLVPVERGREITVKLDTTKHCYFGLHTVRPNLAETFVFKTANEALTYISQGRQYGNHAYGVVHPAFGGGSAGTALKLPFGTFMMDRDCDIAHVAQMRNAFETYTVAMNDNNHLQPTTPARVPWIEFAAAHFQRILLDDKCISPRLQRCLEGCRTDPDVGRYLVKWLTEVKQTKLVEEVKRYTLRSHVTRIGDGDMEAQATGYFFHKDGSALTRQMTNFTLVMHTSVWFGDNDTYYYGVMLANGVETPFKISEKDLQSANKLKITLTAATKSVSDGTNNFQPIFYDHAAERNVMICLKEQLRSFLGVPGIKTLGWNATRTLFNTPVWRAEIAALDASPRLPHPGSSALAGHYSFDAFEFATTYDRVSPQVCTYLALLASMMTRLYLKLPFPIITLRHNKCSYNLLRYIFLAFNQEFPLELNVNKRREITLVPEEVVNIPIFGTSKDPAGVQDQTGYIFALGANGASFSEIIDVETSVQIIAMSYQIQTQLVMWLLRSVLVPDGMLCPAPAGTTDYIHEGVRLVRAATQFTTFDVPPQDTPALNQLLATLTVSELANHFRRNAEGGAELSFRGIESHSRANVLDDLKRAGVESNFHKTNTRVLQADVVQLEALLTKYYGTPVKIPELKVSLV